MDEYISLVDSKKKDDNHSVYISNLPNDVTKYDIRELVTNNNLNPLHCIVALNRKTQQKYAFAIFATKDEANNCVSLLNKTSYAGQLLNVELSIPKGNKPSKVKSNSVKIERVKNSFLIKGFPAKTSEDQVRKSLKHLIDGISFALVKVGDKWRCTFDNLSTCLNIAAKLSSVRVKNPNGGTIIIHSLLPNIVTNSKSPKAGRVFIKNLPINITSDEITSKFSKIDPKCTVHFSGKGAVSQKRFAFVQFSSLKLATKALRLNGTKIKGRKIEVQLAVSKKYYDGDPPSESQDPRDEEEEEIELEEPRESSEKKEKKLKQKERDFDDVSENKTALIQNVPYEATKEELENLFKPYGEIKYVNLVKDSGGKNKGTAFIKFASKESLDNLLNSEESSKALIGEYLKSDKLDSIKASAENIGLGLHGRKLRVLRAVSKEEAKKLKNDNIKNDKKRLYLLKESIKGISEEQKEILNKGKNREKRISSPNTFVSEKRICIRNLPIYLTKQQLHDKLKEHVKGIGKIQVLADKKRKATNLKGQKTKRGKRFGFVEFKTKGQAKQALEYLNSTLDFGQKLVAEFSLEDKRALIERKRKAEELKSRVKKRK